MSLGTKVRLARLFSHPSGKLFGGAVDHFVKKMMQKRLDLRYQTWVELAQDLVRVFISLQTPEQVVPADSTQKNGGHDGVAPKVP